MIAINNLTVEFSAKPIFKEISFFINADDKIGLTGKNGAGKSTLLKILAGLGKPTSGKIGRPAEITIGYLPQQMNVADDTTLIEETKKIFKERFDLDEQLIEINKKIEHYSNPESKEFSELLEKAEYLRDRIAHEAIGDIDSDIEKTLLGLGFKRSDFNRATKEFSGGWRMRIELAKILLKKPDILLLDEPTNHLDIESIQWLEQFLATKAKAVVIVSHDRTFLDNVTKRTIEISAGRIYDYKANYSNFVKLRKDRIEQQKKAYEKQQKEIAEIKTFIEKFRYKPTKSNQVQSRIKQLEKIIPIEIDEVDNKIIHLKFPPAERSGDYPLITENLSKSYGDKAVFEHISFTIKRGEKVAFVGKNGEGKSTLVKCIINEIPFSGDLRIGHNVKIGYFAQNQAQLLDQTITVFETIDRVATGDIRTKINDILGAFMFGGEASEKKVSVLSGGEKTRLAMIKLLLEPVNFLILDEPTNHLDLKTKDILKEALKSFNGTLIVVSHDRYFLDGLVDKIYEFGEGKVREHLGDIHEFLSKKKISSFDQLGSISNSNKISSTQNQKDDNNKEEELNYVDKSGALAYKEMKEVEKQIKRIEKAIKASEEKIDIIEKQIKDTERELSQGNSSPDILERYEKLSNQLAVELGIWEQANNNLENVRRQ